MFAIALPFLSTALLALSLWLAWRAIRTARSPQGAVGWVVFLLAAPYLAIPVYAVLGPHRYKTRLRDRRASRIALAPQRPDSRDRHTQSARRFGDFDPMPLETIAGLPVVGGNRVRLLIDGAKTFEALFQAIAEAREYLLVQFYIFRDDALGRDLADRLMEAAARGVKVRLLFDRVGSAALSSDLRAEMLAAGIEMPPRRWAWLPSRQFQINFRNHRKTVIADGRVGFLGGLNVGDEYLGLSKGYGPWRDSFCRIEGPMVTQLQVIFAEDWHWLTGERLGDALRWTPALPEAGPGPVSGLIVATGPTNADDGGAAMFFAAIAAARRRIWISTPYFVPDLPLLAALKHAGTQGKDMRILVPDSYDHLLPWLAAFAYFDELMESGVEIWRYRGGFLHQKAMLIDDEVSAIGSPNFDQRSFRLNFETMGFFFDRGLARDLESVLTDDFARAARLDRVLAEQPARIRVGAPVARLLAPIL
jgi:cardiolipin synthase